MAYISRGRDEEILQPVILTTASTTLPSISRTSSSSTHPIEMDSFISYFTPSQTTTSGEQQDFPVEFETGGGTSGGGCVIA